MNKVMSIWVYKSNRFALWDLDKGRISSPPSANRAPERAEQTGQVQGQGRQLLLPFLS